ncbi:MAG: prolyl oligopeptidase family serine peptidase [Acidimicrobiales bacterium]
MSSPRPCGTWPSAITADLVVRAAAGLSDVQIDPSTGAIWWSESRPDEGGRVALVRRDRDGTLTEPLPSAMSVRTRVHEYGGRAWWVGHGSVWFVNWADQRIWRLAADADEPEPVTAEPPANHGWRYADGHLSPDGTWVACVREAHVLADGTTLDEARNEIVILRADGSSEPATLVAGSDFVASPRFDPAGGQLAWLVWDHPRMPWDGTELWTAELDLDSALPHLVDPRYLAGGPDESLVQPEWTSDGGLRVVSDRSDWWNLHRVEPRGQLVPLAPVDAEVATPPWVFGQSRYAELADGRTVMALSRDGMDRLAVLVGTDLVEIDTPFTAISALRAVPEGVVCVAASPHAEPAIVRIHLTGATPEIELLRPPRDLGLDPGWFSAPQPISFPSTGGRTAHGLYYPPANPDTEVPEGERPPLLVMSHGGPTGAARPQLSLATQFWTSRGFAVVDVNYGGSTGYGRAYRRQLDGQWGVVDVDDCVAAATHLAADGLVDAERLLIRGGSAGGFTTLAALAFRDTFVAGASHYGVADLLALAEDTHKFESRYLDGLVGPLPEAEAIYRARSPIHHLDGFDRPLIVFQGTEDAIVPPNQSEAIVSALAERGVTVAYLTFEGEQHGFRQAPNIVRALEAELWFYGHVLGFAPDDAIEPVPLVTR